MDGSMEACLPVLFSSLSFSVSDCFLFLTQCFSPNAALHTKESFHPQVKAVCQAQKTGTVK